MKKQEAQRRLSVLRAEASYQLQIAREGLRKAETEADYTFYYLKWEVEHGKAEAYTAAIAIIAQIGEEEN